MKFPPELIYVVIATMGGVARYLNSFANGSPFKLSVFLASGFVAGFSGLMFAQLGIVMGFSDVFIFMLAGMGGFFGEQSLKLIMEIVKDKIE